jgi:hypothetical protein
VLSLLNHKFGLSEDPKQKGIQVRPRVPIVYKEVASLLHHPGPCLQESQLSLHLAMIKEAA